MANYPKIFDVRRTRHCRQNADSEIVEAIGHAIGSEAVKRETAQHSIGRRVRLSGPTLPPHWRAASRKPASTW